MTFGGMLYLILVVATFGFFAIGVGRESLRQTRLDRRVPAERRAQAPHPAE